MRLASTNPPIIDDTNGLEIMSSTCAKGFLGGHCNRCGTNYVMVMYCNKEWCPVCGEPGSAVHKQRWYRWWKHVKQMPKVGYLVFTVPPKYRERLLSKRNLNNARSYIVQFLKEFGYKRGRSRWHWAGDQNAEVWNPHLNVIIDEGYMPKKKLEKIKICWAAYWGIKDWRAIDVHYEYIDPDRVRQLKAKDIYDITGWDITAGKPSQDILKIAWREVCLRRIIHLVKYVTRPTFPKISRESKEFRQYCGVISRYTNDHWWGPAHWTGEEVWQLSNEEFDKGHCLVDGKCSCGGEIRWEKISAQKVAGMKLRSVGGGFYEIIEPGKKNMRPDPFIERLMGRLRE